MKRTAASAACLTALALFAGQAAAQSSVTIYGTLDVGLDRIDKSQGNVQGTVFGVSGTTPVPNSIAAPASVTTRLSPSHTRQSNIGFKGVEDLGGGYRGLFVLEGGITIDNGGLANDNRLFGRQAYVGLTTPVGEIKAGRQASPMLIGYYLVTPEALGSTDFFGAGLVVNTVQTWQDNQLSYAIKQGPITAIVSYATNSGIGTGISAARATATASTPVATPPARSSEARRLARKPPAAAARLPARCWPTAQTISSRWRPTTATTSTTCRSAWCRAPRWCRCSSARNSAPTWAR
jgi:predicted porin